MRSTACTSFLAVAVLIMTSSLALCHDSPAVDPGKPLGGIDDREANLSKALEAGHPVHVLLADPSQAEPGIFFIHNSALLPIEVWMDAYDSQGKLLAMQTITIDMDQTRVAWSNLPPGTTSLILSLDGGEKRVVRVSTPRESGLIFAEFAGRTFSFSPKLGDIALLYNPSENTVEIEVNSHETERLTLFPHELRFITLVTGERRAWISASEEVVIALTSPLSSSLAFSDPQVSIHNTRLYGIDHCGIDSSSGEMSPVLASAYGVIERPAIFSNPEPTEPQCDISYAGSANMVIIKHILTTGEKIWSRYLHLYPLNPNGLLPTSPTTSIVRITKGQRVGLEGRTGYTCGSTGIHLHYEIDTAISATSFGAAVGACESLANTTRSTNPSPNYLTGGTARILLPWMSRQANPTSTNYEVYAIAGAPVYGSLPLQPSSTKTFNNVGISGVIYGTTTASNLFSSPSASLSPSSAPLTGQNTFTAGDYSFYAYSDDGANGFGRGYGVKFSVLPPEGEIVDNDGLKVDTSGDTATDNRQGYCSLMDSGGLDVPGYFLSAKLFPGGGSSWVRWYPQNSALYVVYAHIPKGSTATNVTYKLYLKGRPVNGACSATDPTYPCYTTDSVNHSTSQDGWVRLTAANGTITQFPFVTSSTNSAYVGLSLENVGADTYVGADAVKFVAAPVVTAFSINNGASSTTGRTITLNNTASGGPTSYMASESSNFSGAAWQSYSTTPSFTLSSGNAAKTVYFKVKNAEGESPAKSDTITLNEATAPSVISYSINNNASSTTSRTVTLNNTASGGPTSYMASESSSFSGAAWQSYSTTPSFTLSSGNATKTVYFKVRNAVGELPAKSDIITLNEAMVPSVISYSINNNVSSTTSRTVTLNNTASDGPTGYMASESSSFSGAAWQSYSTAPSFTLSSGNATKTVYFKVRNTVGESLVKSDSIVLSAPPTYVSTPSSGVYTSGGSVLKLKVTFSGTQATFTVAKQDGSAFTSSGTMTIRAGTSNGCVANSDTYYWNYSSGPTITSRTFDLSKYFTAGTKSLYAAIGRPAVFCDGTQPTYYSGKLSITAQ